MKLKDVFEQLSYGELAQLSLGGEQGVIDESNYQRVMASINLGLTDLHSRFLLKEGRTTVTLQTGQISYVLTQEDLLRIERVYDGEGTELSLNAGGNTQAAEYRGCTTPNHKTLVVPPAVTGPVTVVYRANHPLLVKELGYYDANAVEVELPQSHLNALLLFVASRIMNPIGLNQQFHDGNNYWAKYEAACQLLLDQNFRVDQSEENLRLVRNGWV